MDVDVNPVFGTYLCNGVHTFLGIAAEGYEVRKSGLVGDQSSAHLEDTIEETVDEFCGERIDLGLWSENDFASPHTPAKAGGFEISHLVGHRTQMRPFLHWIGSARRTAALAPRWVNELLTLRCRCVPTVGSSGWFGPTALLSVARRVQRHGGEGECNSKENDR